MDKQTDDRSAMALAMGWVSQVTTIALEMALPALGGHWLDQWLGASPIFLLLGVLLGFAAGMWHLLKLAESSKRQPGARLKGASDRTEPDSRSHGSDESNGSVAD